ncbi:alkaline phosphatase family protein [Kribbella sp. WER1]
MPCIIVSPWTAGGWVCSELFDHTSHLRFLEPPTMPSTTGHLRLAEYEVANLPAPVAPQSNQQPPTQAPGRRPRAPPPGGH